MNDPISTAPAWTPAEVLAIQKELFSLGLYRLDLDSRLGVGTSIALVEAFGGDAWRALPASEIRRQLSEAKPPLGTRGEHRLRYGALCRDALLDVTVGVGYDEAGSHLTLAPAIDTVLRQRGFVADNDAAMRVYARAQRPALTGATGKLYVREGAFEYAPLVGAPRRVDAVVRVVVNEDGAAGGATAEAFRSALARADVSYYAGHGRFGSGPDFDPGMTLELLDEKGAREGDAFTDADRFEEALAHEGATKGRNAWAQFLDRAAKGRVRVTGLNEGNIFLNPVNRHPTEFGGRLMYWNLTRPRAQGATLATGPTGALATAAAPLDYRVWVFDGCRTEDYLASIRATPALSAKQVDVIVTKRLTYFNDKAPTLDAFLEGVLAQRSAEQIVALMDARNATCREPGAVIAADGLADNPVIP